MNKILFFLQFAILLSGCKHNRVDIYKDIDNARPATKFIRQISLENDFGKQKPDWVYEHTKKRTRDIGLDSLENGYKDIQIRIWNFSWLRIEKSMLLLRRTNRQWSGEMVRFKESYDTASKDFIVNSHNTMPVLPASGWGSFYLKVKRLKLFDLPDMNELHGYLRGDDGIDFVVEIATASKYRMYHYWSPEENVDKIPEAKEARDLMLYIYQQFSFSE